MTFRRLTLALILTGIAMLTLACRGGNDDADRRAAEVVRQVLQVGQGADAKIEVFVNKMPDGIPDGVPLYSGAKLISSFRIDDEESERYFIIATSTDTVDKLLAFYEEQLDKTPWQVQGATNTDTLTAVRFIRSDDADVDGTVALSPGAEKTEPNNILITVQRAVSNPTSQKEAFSLGDNKTLPKGFPSSVPIYSGSTVTSTTWLRRVGNIDFVITYLTKDPQSKVMDFYRAQLPQGGWKVADVQEDSGESILNFEDTKDPQLNGLISAGTFDEDSSFTEVSLRVRTKSNVRTP